jgi:hypothetical protein
MLGIVFRGSCIFQFIAVSVGHFVAAKTVNVVPFYAKLIVSGKIGLGSDWFASSLVELELAAIHSFPIACPIESAAYFPSVNSLLWRRSHD